MYVYNVYPVNSEDSIVTVCSLSLEEWNMITKLY